MTETTQSPDNPTWPDLAIGLYDKLTGRNAEIAYEFEKFVIHVPVTATPDTDHTPWKVDGVVKIKTREGS
ncbi:MAG: hypothetical protein VX830_06300 [Candidatus Poribacteria bacterium]|nr:hypothetical protein [Candidatus Poribacteria bacterium]